MSEMLDCLYILRMSRVPPIARPMTAAGSGVGRICQAGEMYKERVQWSAQRRLFGTYAIVYVLDGAGAYDDAAGYACDIRPGDLILIFPELAHRYGPDPDRGQVWSEFYIVFEGPVFRTWEAARLLNPDQPVLHLQPVATWRARMAAVLDPMPPVSATASLAEVCRMLQLLADMLAHAAGMPSRGDSAWLDQARQALDLHDDPHLAAERMCCSYATFRRRFTRLAGLSPTRYIAQRRIEQACDLMHRTDLNDKQIAHHLGFCDEFHFSRRFKQIVGVPPSAYRASLP